VPLWHTFRQAKWGPFSKAVPWLNDFQTFHNNAALPLFQIFLLTTMHPLCKYNVSTLHGRQKDILTRIWSLIGITRPSIWIVL
jgi:hypothetical protein